MKKTNIRFILTLLVVGFALTSFTQNVDLPQMSQRAKISQRVGLTWVTIEYSSPSVGDGGSVFGARVPYGQMWGAGDRENTTIEFEDDLKIEGKSIKAGKYGLFMIPNEEKFDILLSKYNRSWSFTYPTEEETVLKVSVSVSEIPFQEWLSYDFIDRGGQDVTAALKWEKVQVPFKLEVVNPDEILLESLKAELKGRGQFLWGAYSDAAGYLSWKSIYLEQAMEWMDKSLALERNWINLQGKFNLLLKMEDNAEAKKYLYELIPLIPNEFVMNNVTYALLNLGDTKKAVELAKKMTQKYADHQQIWAFTDTLAETYLKDGNKKMAIKTYKLARTKAPENQYDYLDGVIANLEK